MRELFFHDRALPGTRGAFPNSHAVDAGLVVDELLSPTTVPVGELKGIFTCPSCSSSSLSDTGSLWNQDSHNNP
ncbi:MAG: hypothetical protein WDM89_02890 [Rhizomicrobium sp.]